MVLYGAQMNPGVRANGVAASVNTFWRTGQVDIQDVVLESGQLNILCLIGCAIGLGVYSHGKGFCFPPPLSWDDVKLSPHLL